MRRVMLLAATLVAVAVVAGCSMIGGAPQPTFDQQFIDMMTPHHQGAVEMAKIAQERAQRPEIKEMAAAIIQAQEAEIATMKGWRKAWFGSDQTPSMTQMPMVPGMSGGGMDHSTSGTMDMTGGIQALRTAAEPFDRAFIDAMIPHHESAIAAAKAAETRAQRAEIKDLARQIVTDQEREIAQMRQWRQAWFGSATP